jgi:hypothetical protein
MSIFSMSIFRHTTLLLDPSLINFAVGAKIPSGVVMQKALMTVELYKCLQYQ